jgi:hypothetical protein
MIIRPLKIIRPLELVRCRKPKRRPFNDGSPEREGITCPIPFATESRFFLRRGNARSSQNPVRSRSGGIW